MRPKRIIGIYNADGGLWGEMRYITGRIFGKSHCALCDITHGVAGKKKSWQQCEVSLGVPVETLHRNELTDELRAVVGQNLPCLVAERESGEFELLVTADTLAAFSGRAQDLAEHLESLLAPSPPSPIQPTDPSAVPSAA